VEWMQPAPARPKPKKLKPPRLRDAEAVLFELKRVNRLMREYAHAHAHAQKGGLTGSQLSVLEALSDDRELSIADLGRLLGLPRSTVTSIVNGLEVLRLAVRLPNPDDRRSTRVSVTKEGHGALAEHGVAWPEATLTKELSHIPMGQCRKVLDGLQVLRQFLEASNRSARHAVIGSDPRS